MWLWRRQVCFANIYIYIYIKQSHYGPDGSRKLRFPDFVTTAQDGAVFTPHFG